LLRMARFDFRIAIAAGLSVVVQIGATILAWGDWSFFAHPARREFVVATIVLSVAACFSGTSCLSSGKAVSLESKRIIPRFILLFLFMTVIPPYCDRRDFWVIDGDTARYLGLALYWIGSVIRLVAIFVLGRRFSGFVAIQEDHKLETGSIYKYIRHPSYAGLLIATIGWTLVFRSVIGLVLNLILFLLLLIRMTDEEKFLENEFGDEYRSYQKKTWRLVPFVY
jgi:protein-S-isoprenylcysteine O-methyltransferase Ste14